MFEGHFRRERAQNYVAYLKAFFGRSVHTASLVPGVGHGAMADLSMTIHQKIEDIFRLTLAACFG